MFITIREFKDKEELKNYLLSIGITEAGVKILSSKVSKFNIEISNIDTRAANILKQDAISVGGDCAVPRKASIFEKGTCTVLLMVTERSLFRLIEKLKLQPFKLKELAVKLKEAVENYQKDEFIISYNGKELKLRKPAIMGILNVTPDSFSDGGKFSTVDRALKHCEEMLESGADIIDVGGESTRPGSDPVPIEEELRRTIPVIEEIRKKLGNEFFISIDTYKSEVAKKALEAGADIVNDISGFHFDKNMAVLVAEKGCPAIVMHIKGTPKDMQKNPYYENVIREILLYFEKTLKEAEKKGVKREQLIIDPGIGFGKRLEDNLCILRRLSEFKTLGLPILIGTSRKSFIGTITGESDPKKRLEGTLASVYASVIRGAKIVRVHDVKETKKFLDTLWALEEVYC
ncbi:dihydropteroate synthase [Desulfurobacterium thermolithotrophum DSM 11699]|uniref:Dihydropteroate synthase n=1 Tax=Desulfurobacterium thermolithotrophum (strain DSM 11699 / BSA) TaxID=868864 RepID=F0S2H3_DESTD|nr:dihydropteroate synthase [Desulfurobacterium thermolithotrophum]ADY73045.1 dihydropteroate synthase [Desulfurobacterium thermolithotrophum DSM 11699]